MQEKEKMNPSPCLRTSRQQYSTGVCQKFREKRGFPGGQSENVGNLACSQLLAV